MSPRTGRPPKNNPRSASIHIRATPEEKAAIMEYSKKTGNTCLELLLAAVQADKRK